ncbi:hypothetical protein ACFOW4_10560 [Micromonospora sp. GCM10011542]|uniref:hypothetical protein n=1 Tax=Micromonospora sp. GCM10011542 TaxID=3317337 RepID=UPI00361137AD
MMRYLVGGLAVASMAIAVLFDYVRLAGRIWRGDTSRMPLMDFGWVVAVKPRTYPSALLCVGAMTGSFALGGIGIALTLGGITSARWPGHILAVGVVMLLTNVVLVPLNWFVEATGRPKFLVPPPHRGQPGSFAAARRRRQRRRAGLPQTGHLAESIQVRPERGDDGKPSLTEDKKEP